MKTTHMRKVPYIQQMRQTECGLCCVAMIMRYYKSFVSMRNVRDRLHVGRDGLKISVLSKYLEDSGLETKVYKAESRALLGLPMPAIIYWKEEHFVILESINDKVAVLVDPAVGRRKIKLQDFSKSYSEIIMVIKPTENFHPVNERENLWIKIIQHIKVKKRLYVKLTIASSLLYLVQLSIPVVIQKLTDGISLSSNPTFSNQYYLVVVLIMVLISSVTFYRGQKILDLQLNIDQYLTKDTFHKMLNLPYRFFENRSNGDLLFRLNCLPVIRDLISEQIIQGILQFGMMLFILGYMLSKSILLTGVAILFLIINILFIAKMKPAMMEANQCEIMEDTKLQGVQVEAVYSAFGIKIAGLEEDILDSWNERYAKSLDAYKQKYMVKNINDSVLSVLQILAPLVLLSIGIFQYMDNKMTMGEAIAIYTLAGNLFTTGMSVFQIVNSFMLATSYLERITDIVDADIEEQPLQPVDLKIKGEIILDNISFSYTNHSANVIEDLSLHIKPGEKVALVGASGCGKSTLVKIIMGLYEPHSGHILFDGVNIEELHKVNLRRQVGVVPQDMTLFNKTIYENICLHRTVDVETVIQVAKIAQIDEEIQKMPMKYQTLVSDMGMNLSGGQRQRIVLARALLNQPELIILDEATSALDNENEQRVSTYFETMKCTRLIIAHRLSTIIDCDKIIVLERGKIKEMGTHGELMQQGGVYSNLYNIVENTVRLA